MNFISRIFKPKKIDIRLVGQWEGMAHEERIIMRFSANGKLEYQVHTGDKIQIIKLTFSTSNDFLITEQPSHPRKEVTKYRINGDVLILDYNGEVSNYRKR